LQLLFFVRVEEMEFITLMSNEIGNENGNEILERRLLYKKPVKENFRFAKTFKTLTGFCNLLNFFI